MRSVPARGQARSHSNLTAPHPTPRGHFPGEKLHSKLSSGRMPRPDELVATLAKVRQREAPAATPAAASLAA
jgi:hypothetical protein